MISLYLTRIPISAWSSAFLSQKNVRCSFDDTCVDHVAPLFISVDVSYLRDSLALGIPDNEAMICLVSSRRSFSFGNTVFKSLYVAPAFFIADSSRIFTFSRDTILSEKMLSV